MYKKIVVPVSGGKDSQVCVVLALSRFPRRQLLFVFQDTGYDHTDTFEQLLYIEKRYKIKIVRTRSSVYNGMFDFIRKVGYFPNSVARGCTSRLKQQPFAQWLRDNKLLGVNDCLIYMGMRSDESAKRKSKYGDLTPDDIFTLPDLSSEYGKEFINVKVSLPIVNWTTEDVFSFLKQRGDRVNTLYSKGHHRVGCYPCLLARNAEWEAAAKDPLGRKHIKELLDIEQEFIINKNPRKLIKVHQTRDVKGLYERGVMGTETDDSQCGWCSI